MDVTIELIETVSCVLCISSHDPATAIYCELESKVVNLLCRHFWFAPGDIRQKYVCSSCWRQVEDFNTFYEQIDRIHYAALCNAEEQDTSELEGALPSTESVDKVELDEPDPFLDDSNIETTILIETTSDIEDTVVEDASETDLLLAIDSNTKETSEESNGTTCPTLFENGARNESKEMEGYKCDQCDRVYPKRHLLNKHRKLHIPASETLYPCTECGKSYASDWRLQQHQKRVHGPGFMCDVCPKWYKTGEALRRHQRYSHNSQETERVECNICKRWLKNKGSLRKHLNRHKTSGKQNVCDICGKVAPTYTALKSHKLFVHKMEKSYQCTICNKAFKRAFTLEEHMTIHTGGTLYKCPHCTRTFNSSANLHGHKKKVHPKEWEKSRIEYEKRFMGDNSHEEDIS